MTPTYRTPDNPGFIGGVFWQGVLASWFTRLLAISVVTTLLGRAAIRDGWMIPDAHVMLLGVPLYAPWRCLIWYGRYWHEMIVGHGLFHWTLIFSLTPIFVSFFYARLVSEALFKTKVRQLAKNQDQLYGSNHWATQGELNDSRLLDGHGILLGGVELE